MQRWMVEFEAETGRLAPSLRWAQCLPLGLSILGEYAGAHRGLTKPHTVRSVTVDRTGRSVTAVVCWLSDTHPSPVKPEVLPGRVFEIGGIQVRCVRAELIAEVTQLALMGDVFTDPWLPDPGGSIVDPVVEFRVRSVSPWVFSAKDPTGEVHAGRLTTRMAQRWNDVLVWQPDSTPESRRAGAGAAVPKDVVDELSECTSLVSVSRLDPVKVQVSFDKQRGKDRTRSGVVVDAVLRCAPEQVSTLLWFQTLMRFAVWSGVATGTTSGLGQLEVRQVRRLSDLPRAVVPEWEVW